jgi:riboflavin kinase / FMN adenylyltransferase
MRAAATDERGRTNPAPYCTEAANRSQIPSDLRAWELSRTLIVSGPPMEVFDGYRALFRPLAAPAVCLGNFDGVHVGHARLFAETTRAARQLGGDAVVYTFEPHPARVLAPDLAPPLITPRPRRLELIGEHGIDVCILEPFTAELAALEPDEFVTTVLVRTLKVRAVVVGYDFTYGRRRAGTTEHLTGLGKQHGFAVHVVPQVTVDGLVASSTKVRDFALRGKLEGVRMLLGRDLDVDGTVIRGAGRGRQIGVPTANVAVDGEILLPKPGVYAVRAQLLDTGQTITGVANLGTNPTFVAAGALSLEVHLFDFARDIYDRRLRVAFVARIRGERRFDGPAALIDQIRADMAQARGILGQGDTKGDQ